MTEHVIRDREEVSEQIRALGELKEMAKIYGFDISEPATNAKRSCTMVILRILGSYQTTKRCCDVYR